MITAIIQARMSSSRLPGKVMRPILGAPMLARQIERVSRARRLERLVIATSDHPSDNPIEAFCTALGIRCHRGSLTDVLGRFWGAEQQWGPSEHIVRLTGDCPLADWEVIDQTIDFHVSEMADFTSNDQKLTFPKGLDVEVFRAEHLKTAAREAEDPYEREHVTPFFLNHPERYRLANMECNPPMGHLRWTVDTEEDFEFVERVYRELYPAKPDFTSEDIFNLTKDWPQRGRDG